MAGERQVKQEVQADPFQGLLDSLLPQREQITTVSSPYSQQLANVLASQQAAYSGGNDAATRAIADLVVRQAQGQRAGIESRVKASGGYNSAAQRLAKDRVDMEAANKAALQSAQLNQAERANASTTASNLARSSTTQRTGAAPQAVSDVLKAVAISQGLNAVPALVDMVKGVVNNQTAATANTANQLSELTIDGVTYDNPAMGASKVLGPASAGLATAGGLAAGPVGLAVGGLLQKYGADVLSAVTGTKYATQAQWDQLVKNNPTAVQAAMQQAGLAPAEVNTAASGAGINPSASAFNMPDISYSLGAGLPAQASPTAFSAVSMTPAGELLGSQAFDPGFGAGSSSFDFSSPDYSIGPSSSSSSGGGGLGDGGSYGLGLDSAGSSLGNDMGYASGGIGGGASGTGLRGAGSYGWDGGFGSDTSSSDLGSDIDRAQSDSGLW